MPGQYCTLVRGEIELSIVICHHIFCLYLARLQSAKNDEGEVILGNGSA